MKRLILTQKELENMVEKALENACAYLAAGRASVAYRSFCEARALLGLLEDLGVWYDEEDEPTVNEHVQEMLDIMRGVNFVVTTEA